MNIWSFEQDNTNSIAIFRGSAAVACIISDSDDISEKEIETAQFIIDACNEKEK